MLPAHCQLVVVRAHRRKGACWTCSPHSLLQALCESCGQGREMRAHCTSAGLTLEGSRTSRSAGTSWLSLPSFYSHPKSGKDMPWPGPGEGLFKQEQEQVTMFLLFVG